MDNGKGVSEGDGGIGVAEKHKISQGEAEALKKCLQENEGDHAKCKAKVEAFQSSSSSPRRKPLRPLRRICLTDV